jgi:hypothetical protein
MPPRSKDGRKAPLHAWLFELQLRLLPIVIPLAIVVIIIAIVLSATSLSQLRTVKSNTDRIDDITHALQGNEVKACERVNVLRRRVNNNAGIIYRVLLAASKSNSSANKQYASIIRTVDYAPETDCKEAVEKGALYTPPDAIPIFKLDHAGRFNVKTGEVK